MKKLLAAKTLVDSGLLFEINRQIMHPRNLALVVIEHDDGSFEMSQELMDFKDDDGIHFDEESVRAGEEKLRKFDGR